MQFVIETIEQASCAVADTPARFPVHRIYCVGRNYAEHAREMGGDPTREAPFFFTKPADAVVDNDASVAYPPATENLHHEIELVVALGRGGIDLTVQAAQECIFGYAVGNDLTRRDLQSVAKHGGRPWDTAKGFDQSAPIAPIHPVSACGTMERGDISLSVNGELRQQGRLEDMIWRVPEIISHLSGLFALRAGDLIFTGTPAGVGPLLPGDRVEGSITGLTALRHQMV